MMTITPREFYERAKAQFGDDLESVTISARYGSQRHSTGAGELLPIFAVFMHSRLTGSYGDTPDEAIQKMKDRVNSEADYKEYLAWKAERAKAVASAAEGGGQ